MGRSRLAGFVVLVVEDEPLVGLDLVDLLSAAGAHVISAKRGDEALSLVDRVRVAAAVLDINLGDHDCTTICQRLLDRGIPFLFYTGYLSGLEGWDNVPVIRKPAVPEDMVEAVQRLCGSIQKDNRNVSAAGNHNEITRAPR